MSISPCCLSLCGRHDPMGRGGRGPLHPIKQLAHLTALTASSACGTLANRQAKLTGVRTNTDNHKKDVLGILLTTEFRNHIPAALSASLLFPTSTTVSHHPPRCIITRQHGHIRLPEAYTHKTSRGKVSAFRGDDYPRLSRCVPQRRAKIEMVANQVIPTIWQL